MQNHDDKGFTSAGTHIATGTKYDSDGYDANGYDEWGYDRNGLDRDGYNEFGFDRKGYHSETGEKYDPDGYDCNGYDEYGYDKQGYTRKGYDRNGNLRPANNLEWYEDKEFNSLYDELVPRTGKCDSVAGEMLRAAQRISYRFYNDGEIATQPDLNEMIRDLAEQYIDDEYDDIIGDGRLSVREEADAYEEAWQRACARAEEEIEDDTNWDYDQLRAGAATHYLMTKGNGDVRNLVSGMLSYGPEMSDTEYSEHIHALCDAVKDDVKQHPELRNVPTEDMFDHMGEGPAGEHMPGEFDDRAIIDHRIVHGRYGDKKSLRESAKEGLTKSLSSLFQTAKQSVDDMPKTGDIDVSAYDYTRDGKHIHVKAHKRKRS